jgi:hypothetical protein
MAHKVKWTLPDGTTKEGVDVPIQESTERWSELLLDDGTTIRVKQVVGQVLRVDGEWDEEGNPLYVVKSNPQVALVHVQKSLRKPEAQ